VRSTLDPESLNVLGREVMTERLREAVEGEWPFRPEAWMTAGGGTEALLLAIESAAPRGSIVAVDEPLAPGMLDTLRDLGVTAIGVAADAAGPMPSALIAAFDAGATAFVVQPGAPFAARHVLTAERAAELAEVIAARSERIWVVEDDSIGPLETAPSPSLGGRLHGRVLRIRSFCKAYGIDVRTSVMGGPAELISRANSRILQNALAHLIRSPEAAALVALARARYASRRAALVDALTTRGLTAHAGEHAVVVWVEVPEETQALIALARRGVVVGAGSRAFVDPPDRSMLRISVTQLPIDPALIGELADYIAEAARSSSREFFD
jgi:DNA-binding transcriptional MocR family regulator